MFSVVTPVLRRGKSTPRSTLLDEEPLLSNCRVFLFSICLAAKTCIAMFFIIKAFLFKIPLCRYFVSAGVLRRVFGRGHNILGAHPTSEIRQASTGMAEESSTLAKRAKLRRAVTELPSKEVSLQAVLREIRKLREEQQQRQVEYSDSLLRRDAELRKLQERLRGTTPAKSFL